VSLREHGRSCLQPTLTRLPAASLPRPAPAHAGCLLARRYAEYDLYGLAASLATSWAALAASSLDKQETSKAHALLHNFASMLQKASPHLCLWSKRPLRAARSCRAQAAPPSRLRAVQVVGQWCVSDETDVWGEAAVPGSAVLTRYHSDMSALLLRLASTPEVSPQFQFSPAADSWADSKGVFSIAAQARLAARAGLRSCASGTCQSSPLGPAAAPDLHVRDAQEPVPTRRPEATCHLPGDLQQRCRRRPPGPHVGVGLVRRLRCAPGAVRSSALAASRRPLADARARKRAGSRGRR